MRLYEILKRGKDEGLDYVILTNLESCENASKIFPDFLRIIENYDVIQGTIGKTESKVSPIERPINYCKRIFKLALSIYKAAENQNVDLIVYPSESLWGVLASYLASLFSSKPWTAIIQPGASLNSPNLFQPTYSLAPLNPFNVFAHIKSRTKTNNLGTISKVGLCLDFLLLLKVSEKTTMLTVSNSVVEDFGYLNPRVRIYPISPGNGVDSAEYAAVSSRSIKYQGVFFGRLIPEKGFFDLIDIWAAVVKKSLGAKLAVCGIVEEKKVLEEFVRKVEEKNLSNSIELLGQPDRSNLVNIVAESYLTINPSYVDAFSLTTLESLACGTPVVAYNLPASKHNFSKCSAVFRCPTGDSLGMANTILHVLKTNRKTLTEEARKFAAAYDWSQVVKAEKAAYSQVIYQKYR